VTVYPARAAGDRWQAGDRALPALQVSVARESALFVDPAEIPAAADITRLGRALTPGGRRPWRANGPHHGLQRAAVGRAGRPDHRPGQPGHPRDLGRPQGGRGRRAPLPQGAEEPQTAPDHYPRTTPVGYPLAERLAARLEQTSAEGVAGSNSLGLIFPSPAGRYWRTSNYSRQVLKPAYLAAGWRDAVGHGDWTWHSLRHVFCTTALFTWKLDATDVSGWSARPTTASPWTCTSAPPPASWTAPEPPSNSHPRSQRGPGRFTPLLVHPVLPSGSVSRMMPLQP
jgi:hypothetical protein